MEKKFIYLSGGIRSLMIGSSECCVNAKSHRTADEGLVCGIQEASVEVVGGQMRKRKMNRKKNFLLFLKWEFSPV